MTDPASLASVEAAARESGGSPFPFGKGGVPSFWVPVKGLRAACAAASGIAARLEAILAARVKDELLLTYVFRLEGSGPFLLRATGSPEAEWDSVVRYWRSARADEEALSARFGMVFR